MLKRKGFATLSGILLAISIIAPFSFTKVNADFIGNPTFRVLYSFDVSPNGDATYVYADFIYHNDYRASGYFSMSFISSGAYSYGVFDGYGVTDIDGRAPTGTGYRIVDGHFDDTGYFVIRVIWRNTNSFWSSTQLRNPTNAMDLTFNAQTTYANGSSSELALLSRMTNYLQTLVNTGMTVDTTAIQTLLSQIITNQQTIITNQTLNPAASDVVDDNDDLIDQGTDVIGDYDDLVSTFDSDFGDQQEEMTDILQNTSLTAFSDAAIWFTQQLGSLYTSMGDMAILVTLPLILGVALFFIGRGSIVFRAPNVETVTQTWTTNTDQNGYKSSSYTSNRSITRRHRGWQGPKKWW